MNNIEKVYKKLMKRLPKKYHYTIKVYKNTQTLLKAYCKIYRTDYKELVKFYTNYFATHKYKSTKYFRGKNEKKKVHTAFDILAISTHPISISGALVETKSEAHIAFIILHEIGHFVVGSDEIKADDFAIRWIKKLHKENIL